MADNGIKLPPGAVLKQQPKAAPKLPAGATLKSSPVGAAASPPPAPPPAPAAPISAGAGPTPKPYQVIDFPEFMKGAEAWARGASFGTSDDASAFLAATILKARGDERKLMDIYRVLDKAENERIDQWQKEHPYVGKGTEVVGMFTSPGAGRVGEWIGNGATKFYRMLRAATVGAGYGALSGAGYGKEGEKIQAAEHGAGIGAIMGPLAQGAIEIVSPKITQAAQYLIDRGVKPTVGQLMGGAAKATEEKATSIPLTGDLIKNAQRGAVDQFNRATYNDVLSPIGIKIGDKAPIGHEGFANIDDIISSKYDELLPKLTFNPTSDPTFKAEINAVDMAANTLPAAEKSSYINLMNEWFASRLSGGRMSGNTFKGSESEMAAEIRGILTNNNSTFYQKKLAYLLQDALGAMRSSLTRTNPGYGADLQNLNNAYMRLTRLQRAVGYLGAKDGVFTPAQLLSAVKALSPAKQFARGEAPMQELAGAGKEVLGNTYPDSGTAGRALLGYLGLEGIGKINPVAAMGLGATGVPYLPGIRNWFSSPLAQSTGSVLRSAIPGAAGVPQEMQQ